MSQDRESVSQAHGARCLTCHILVCFLTSELNLPLQVHAVAAVAVYGLHVTVKTLVVLFEARHPR